jgi:hypothetical protein
LTACAKPSTSPSNKADIPDLQTYNRRCVGDSGSTLFLCIHPRTDTPQHILTLFRKNKAYFLTLLGNFVTPLFTERHHHAPKQAVARANCQPNRPHNPYTGIETHGHDMLKMPNTAFPECMSRPQKLITQIKTK